MSTEQDEAPWWKGTFEQRIEQSRGGYMSTEQDEALAKEATQLIRSRSSGVKTEGDKIAIQFEEILAAFAKRDAAKFRESVISAEIGHYPGRIINQQRKESDATCHPVTDQSACATSVGSAAPKFEPEGVAWEPDTPLHQRIVPQDLEEWRIDQIECELYSGRFTIEFGPDEFDKFDLLKCTHNASLRQFRERLEQAEAEIRMLKLTETREQNEAFRRIQEQSSDLCRLREAITGAKIVTAGSGATVDRLVEMVEELRINHDVFRSDHKGIEVEKVCDLHSSLLEHQAVIEKMREWINRAEHFNIACNSIKGCQCGKDSAVALRPTPDLLEAYVQKRATQDFLNVEVTQPEDCTP